MNHAERFMNLVDALNALRTSYERRVPPKCKQSDYPPALPNEDYLLTHLKWMVSQQSNPIVQYTRSGQEHQLLARADGKDGRRDLPKAIVNKLREADSNWTQSKFEVKWIVCYINNVLPDQTKRNWQLFECSHTCIEDFCVSPNCLCWESKSVNQSRGQSYCTKVCAHAGCGQIICACQSIHVPTCR